MMARLKRAQTKNMALRRRAVILAACGLAAGSRTGCLAFGLPPAQPTVDAAAIPGMWVSGDGASITFTSSGTFTEKKFNYAHAELTTCRAASGSGTWEADLNSTDPPSEMPPNVVALFFTSGPPGGNCAIIVQMTTWDTGSTQGCA
jgi:hypothetical protein